MKKKFQKLSLLITAFAMIVIALGITSCKKDDKTDPIPPVIVLDGYYVKGAGTAYPDFNAGGMMKSGKNEVTQKDRSQLLELYIPVKAGSDGFSIVQVAGSVTKIYGPGANWATITVGTTDEPKVPFQRGDVAETGTKFTVPTDGMYHVVYDTELGVAIVAPVHWGVIGGATPAGWGTSTELTESAFNLTTMTWTITGMPLLGGEWKLRYSNGWKIEIDTTYTNPGSPDRGVKVNTNFGGSKDTLVAGGANITNTDPGIYNITLRYVLGTGYTVTTEKTGALPLTSWEGVQVDAVGTGVSVDNPAAIPDPSTWLWGNVLVADNGGVPVKLGDLYTWTWTGIILEANEGFKLRTLNGVAPPSGGNNFDVGFPAVNIVASVPQVIDLGGNLGVTEKGSYTIVLTIDAAATIPDTKSIIITKN